MSNAPSAPPTLPTAPPPPAVRPEIPPTLGRVIDVYSNRWDGPRSGSICRVIRDDETGVLKAVRVNLQLDGIDDADILAQVRKAGHGCTVELVGARVFDPMAGIAQDLFPPEGDWYVGKWMPFQIGQAPASAAVTTRLAEAESKLGTLLDQFSEHLAQARPGPGMGGTIASIQASLSEATHTLDRLAKNGMQRDEDILALDTGVSIMGDKAEKLFTALINAVGSFGPVFNELEHVLLKVYEGVQPLGISIDFKALGEAKLECILKLEEMAQTLEQAQKDAVAEDRAPTPDAGAQAAAAVNEDATRAAMGDAPASGEALAGDAPAKPVPGSET